MVCYEVTITPSTFSMGKFSHNMKNGYYHIHQKTNISAQFKINDSE